MKKTLRIFLLVFVLLKMQVVAQNEASKWYFGPGGMVDFMFNPPVISPASPSNTAYTSHSSIAGANGNLILHSNGLNIYNSSHTVIPNGSGLIGQNGNSSPVLFVPNPGNASQFYVFNIAYSGAVTTSVEGLYYSLVDMSLAAGQGSVVAKNIPVYLGPTGAGLAAVRQCNGTDYWVMIRDRNPTNTTLWNGISKFYAFNLNSAGVNSVAAVSTFTYANTVQYSQVFRGTQLKFSPNGKYLACSLYSFIGPYSSSIGTFELYDFNNFTGLLSNQNKLYTGPSVAPSNSSAPNADAMGIEFSPDASKIYGSLSNNYYYPNGSVLEWDLCNGNTPTLNATQVSVGNPPPSSPTNSVNGLGQMQLAPDGKIYIAPYQIGAPYQLSVINNPNAYGAAAGFSLASFSINPGSVGYYLPKFSSHLFFLAGSVPAFSTSAQSSTLGCQVLQFQSPYTIGSVTGNCPANTRTLQSLQWDFGEPSSGTLNVSNASSPSHTYSAVGIYTVKLTMDFGCGAGTITKTQTVNVVNPAFGSLAHTSSLTCFGVNTGTAAYINAQSSGLTYFWNNGISTFTTPSISNLGIGNWTTSVTYTPSGCVWNNTFTIIQPPPITVTVSPSGICQNGTVAVTGTGGVSPLQVLWSNGNTAATGASSLVGVNTVSITDINTCVGTSTFMVWANPVLTVSSASICSGNPATLQAAGALAYTWMPGSTATATLIVSPSTTGFFVVSGASAQGCTASAQATVQVTQTPTLSTMLESNFCTGAATLSASGAVGYIWTPGLLTGNLITVNPTLTTSYTVTGANGNCTSSAVSMVSVGIAPPLLISSAAPSICAADCFSFSFSPSDFSVPDFSWGDTAVSAPGTNAHCYMQPGTYTIHAIATYSNGCRAQSANSLTLKVVARPTAVLSAQGGSVFLVNKEVVWRNDSKNATRYTLDFGDGTTRITQNAGGNVTHPYSSAGVYCSTLRAINDTTGCSDVIYQCVEISCPAEIRLPNVFTPNGDGVNDVFFFETGCIKYLECTIFDRWSNLVYHWTGTDGFWDGHSVLNKASSDGVYFYTLKYVDESDNMVQKPGTVLIIR